MSLLQSLMRLLFGALGIPADGDVVTYDAAEGKVKWGASAGGATPFSSFTLAEDLIVTGTPGAQQNLTGWTIDASAGDIFEIHGYFETVNTAGVSNSAVVATDRTTTQAAFEIFHKRSQGAAIATASQPQSTMSIASSLAAAATAKCWFVGTITVAEAGTIQIKIYQTPSTEVTLKAGSTFKYRKLYP